MIKYLIVIILYDAEIIAYHTEPVNKFNEKFVKKREICGSELSN